MKSVKRQGPIDNAQSPINQPLSYQIISDRDVIQKINPEKETLLRSPTLTSSSLFHRLTRLLVATPP